MKVSLKADERDGCVATISGCGVGGHTATFRFMAPEYQVDPIKFDGDTVSFSRDVLHGSVIAKVGPQNLAELQASVAAHELEPGVVEESGELRATLEAYEADTERKRKPARKWDKPDESTPRGAVKADDKEVVQQGDTAGDSQFEAAGEPRTGD